MTSTKKTLKEAERRSPCPVACTLDILGDRWTLLVIRDLVLGRSRFKDFTSSPDGSKHRAYQLTTKGESLRPILAAMRDWGLTWEKGTKVLLQPPPPPTNLPKPKKQSRPA